MLSGCHRPPEAFNYNTISVFHSTTSIKFLLELSTEKVDLMALLKVSSGCKPWDPYIRLLREDKGKRKDC